MKKVSVFLIGVLLCACSQAQVTQYKYKVVKDYPHDMAAYTQGLFFHSVVILLPSFATGL